MNSGLCSFTFQAQTQLNLLWNPLRTQLFPEELVEKVSTWHLPSLSSGLTVFTHEHAVPISPKFRDT